MSAFPKISVCIPVYNPGSFLQSAISSVLTQQYEGFELIIVDDCSSQDVKDILKEFNDPRIAFYRNPNNLGLVGNWNRCLELAQGEFITLFHQDDVMHIEYLAQEAAMLDAHPNLGFVYSNIMSIDGYGRVTGGHPIKQPEADTIMSGWEIFRKVAETGNPIACPTVMARKECYQHLGGFDPRLRFAIDLEMWLRIAGTYDVGYLAQPLVYRRTHAGQETNRFLDTGKDYLDVLHAFDIAFFNPLPQTHSIFIKKTYQTLSKQSINMAKWMIKQGKLSQGIAYSEIALKSLMRLVNRRILGVSKILPKNTG